VEQQFFVLIFLIILNFHVVHIMMLLLVLAGCNDRHEHGNR
jgi:hypothetical protein